jgi:hypothetical protein
MSDSCAVRMLLMHATAADGGMRGVSGLSFVSWFTCPPVRSCCTAYLSNAPIPKMDCTSDDNRLSRDEHDDQPEW